jgi:hypothetical protein
MLRKHDGRFVSLRGTPALMWTLLERGASIRTIRKLLLSEYGVPTAWIETELAAIIEQLVRTGLIEQTA